MTSQATEHLFWVPGLPGEVDSVAERAGELSATAGQDGEIASDLQFCLREALNNVVEHALDGTGETVEVRMTVQRRGFDVTISDSGRPMVRDDLRRRRPAIPPNAPALPERGFGLEIIHRCADRVIYGRRGGMNVLNMSRTARG